ncbi:MAG: hypothetical protein P0Y64_06100 [Candidatus Sphingomonas colombiensis]|nr:hypothetical protein [Sphingomonas sp.]WEK44375.1 MAG: hypothetical protein P0Y64_06100 [Sphingomonas sp.]
MVLRACGSTFAVLVLMAGVSPVLAQEVKGGHVAGSAVGEAGQRQTKEQGVTGIKPMARINSRIPNRVQSRIGNRIDRYYDPYANATSPFATAGDQARTAGKPRGR